MLSSSEPVADGLINGQRAGRYPLRHRGLTGFQLWLRTAFAIRPPLMSSKEVRICEPSKSCLVTLRSRRHSSIPTFHLNA